MIVSFWASFLISRSLLAHIRHFAQLAMIYRALRHHWGSPHVIIAHPGLNPAVITSIIGSQFKPTSVLLRRNKCVVAAMKGDRSTHDQVYMEALSLKNGMSPRISGPVSYLDFCRLLRRYFNTSGYLGYSTPSLLRTRPFKTTVSKRGIFRSSSLEKRMNVFVIGENEKLAETFSEILNHSKYVVYHLTASQATQQAWCSNAALVVMTISDERLVEKLLLFVDSGGLVINLSGKSLPKAESIPDSIICPSFTLQSFVEKSSQLIPVLQKLGFSCRETTEESDMKRTNAYCADISKLPSELKDKNFALCLDSVSEPSENSLSLIQCSELPGFDLAKFNQYLKSYAKSSCNGIHVADESREYMYDVIHVPVVDSTWPITTLLAGKDCHDYLVTCDVQLKGIGRNQNKWISNRGCCMFSSSLCLASLGRLPPSTLPLLVAMATCAVVREREGGRAPVAIKWPNDVYCAAPPPLEGGQQQPPGVKIGGILVTGAVTATRWTFQVGMGVNLDNCNPTTCINDMLSAAAAAAGPRIPPFSREELIAGIVTRFRQLVHYCRVRGFDADVKREYCRHWLHSGQEVTYSDGVNRCSAVVKSVDDEGFLLVETESGHSVSLHPDYNRFDMMENLIYPLKRS